MTTNARIMMAQARISLIASMHRNKLKLAVAKVTLAYSRTVALSLAASPQPLSLQVTKNSSNR